LCRAIDLWAYQCRVIRLLAAWQADYNSFTESFNSKLRAEYLNTYCFMSLDDARAKLEDSRRDYNETRSHSSIGNKAPISLLNGSSAPLADRSLAPKNSSTRWP
jgi:putative transposase